MALLCFDFDNTLVKGHFHNTLMEITEQTAGIYGKTAKEIMEWARSDPRWMKWYQGKIQKLVDDPIKGPKNPAELKDVIQTALKSGHKIAITSFTLFPEVIKPTLVKIGLAEEEIKQIHLECFLLQDQQQGKIPHMIQAMDHFNIDDRSQVILIDDNSNNCQTARANGFKAVDVPVEPDAAPEYLMLIKQEVEMLIKQEVELLAKLNQLMGGEYKKGQVDKEGNTALHLAIINGDFELVKYLLENGENPNIKNAKGDAALMAAFQLEREEIYNVIIAAYNNDLKINMTKEVFIAASNNILRIDGLSPIQTKMAKTFRKSMNEFSKQVRGRMDAKAIKALERARESFVQSLEAERGRKEYSEGLGG